MNNNICKGILAIGIFLVLPCSCGTVTFNMSGASVSPAKTCQVNYIENRAEIVNPRLSLLMTEGLKDKIQANSSLNLVNSNADVLFEGEITGYNVQPQSVTAAGMAAKDRLTVTVKIKFTNEVKPENSFEKSFSRFYEYTTGTGFSSIENTAVDEILVELMDDIFNAAFSSW
ncbi:MAG: LPS assembly lipoprotein LptE [Bacteroidales bacterium]|nr:LPS assembly lipoprotein LptE [Bacteroidales bacterium]